MQEGSYSNLPSAVALHSTDRDPDPHLSSAMARPVLQEAASLDLAKQIEVLGAAVATLKKAVNDKHGEGARVNRAKVAAVAALARLREDRAAVLRDAQMEQVQLPVSEHGCWVQASSLVTDWAHNGRMGKAKGCH